MEHKEEADDAESGVVRYVIKGLIDDTGNMVRPYFGEEAKMGTDSTQLIERTIVTLSQYL